VSEDAFERLFRSAARTRRVSTELKPLLHGVYDAVDRNPSLLRSALERLLSFLASPSGRTDANCCVTDLFFSGVESWDLNLDALPPPLRAFLSDLGGTLHDTVYAPHIAANFESLPEQLLQRLHRIG
jgi:hypothetical protein